jgi:hypothetical protein
MIQGKIEPIEELQKVVIFDWVTGAEVAQVLPSKDGEWSYDGELPPLYAILYRAHKNAPRVEGPYR